jgi:hypothetical protein
MEYLKDMVKLGKMTADQANVEMVRMERVYIVNASIPREVRAALNAAVKAKYLGHKKREGRKPEVYYHPAFEYLVNGERNQYELDILNALAKVCGRNEEVTE